MDTHALFALSIQFHKLVIKYPWFKVYLNLVAGLILCRLVFVLHCRADKADEQWMGMLGGTFVLGMKLRCNEE